MGENKNNSKVCFQHCGQAGSQSYTEQCVPVIPSSNDFTNFYTNEILIIREKKSITSFPQVPWTYYFVEWSLELTLLIYSASLSSL